MTGVVFTYKLDDAAARRAFAKAGSDLADMTAMYDEIGAYLETSTVLRFDDGVDPQGQPWLPSQRVLQFGGKTLIKGGFLRSSITHDAGPDFAEVGTNLVYGGIHQEGGQAGRGGSATIPQRAYLGISAADEVEIGAIVADFVDGLLPSEGSA